MHIILTSFIRSTMHDQRKKKTTGKSQELLDPCWTPLSAACLLRFLTEKQPFLLS